METMFDSLEPDAGEIISVDRCKAEFVQLENSLAALDKLFQLNTSTINDISFPLDSAFDELLKLAESIRGDYDLRLYGNTAVRETDQSPLLSLLDAFVALEQETKEISTKATEMLDESGQLCDKQLRPLMLNNRTTCERLEKDLSTSQQSLHKATEPVANLARALDKARRDREDVASRLQSIRDAKPGADFRSAFMGPMGAVVQATVKAAQSREAIIDLQNQASRLDQEISDLDSSLAQTQSSVSQLEGQISQVQHDYIQQTSITEALTKINETVMDRRRTAFLLVSKTQAMKDGAVALMTRTRELQDVAKAAKGKVTKDEYARAVMDLCDKSVEARLRSETLWTVMAELTLGYGSSPPSWLSKKVEEVKTMSKFLAGLENSRPRMEL